MRWPIVLAIVGIAVGIVAEVAPLYVPETPAWVWGVLFWSAIIVIIGAVFWGIWPRISPYAPIIQISWPQGRRLWSRLIDRLRKIKLKSNFVAEQTDATWNKVEMGTFHMGQNEEETVETVAENRNPLDVDLRWWPKDKVFCEYAAKNSVRCKRASDTARHEHIEIKYEIWIRQDGAR